MPEPHRQSAPEALPVSTLETFSSASSSSATLIPTTPTISTAPTTIIFPTTSIRPGFKDEPSEHPPQGPPPWFCAVFYFLQYISFNLIWYFVNLHGPSMRTSREWAICGLTSGLITSPMIYSGFRTVRWISDYIANCLNESTRTGRVIAAIGALYGIVVVGLVFRTTGVMAEVVSQNCIFVAQTGILPGASLALVFCQLHRTGCQLHHTRTHRTELSGRGMPHVDGVEMVITPIQKSQEQPGERLFGMDASPGAGLLLSTAVYLIAFLSAYTLSLQTILTSDDVDTSEHDDAVVFLFLFDLLAVFPCLGFSLGTSVQCLSNVFFGKPFDFRCIVGGFLGMPVAIAGILLSGASKEMQSMEWWLLVQAATLPGAFVTSVVGLVCDRVGSKHRIEVDDGDKDWPLKSLV